MNIQTLAYSPTGRPSIVDAETMAAVDVTPIPTSKMQRYLNDNGMRITCGADRKLHIRVNPFGGEAA